MNGSWILFIFTVVSSISVMILAIGWRRTKGLDLEEK